MPRLLIDDREVEVTTGGTILDAARKLGLDIPTLCFLNGCCAATSCMVCLVKVKGNGYWQDRLVPSCAAIAEEGMQIESRTPEVHQARRAALELLLSDHVGDCIAPCQRTCPAHMDIPLMIRQIAAGELREAIVTVKKDIALPAVLGRICPEVCEHRCRRGQFDEPLAICQLKRHVADVDLASDAPYVPPCRPSTGKKVAIVGAGPAGLSAAYYLLQDGHACTLFDDHARPGGGLRYGLEAHRLPRDVLDAEIAVIEKLGADFQGETRIGVDASLDDLRQGFDAVLAAVGPLNQDDADRLGLQTHRQRLQINAHTYETPLPGVFAAGAAVRRGRSLAVRSVADGKAAALCIGHYLSARPVTAPKRPFTTRVGRLSDAELAAFMSGVSPSARTTPSGGPGRGFTREQARAEALRCVRCDCRKTDDCRLRRYSQVYGANAVRYRAAPRAFERRLQHADIVYEPGKCIACGLCIQIAEAAGEPLGLTFVGRGFDVRVGVPFGRSIAEGLVRVAGQCADACPTGALAARP